MNAALVELIEDHHIDPAQFRVGLDHSCHDPFGNDLQTSCTAGFRFTTNSKTYALPYLLS